MPGRRGNRGGARFAVSPPQPGGGPPAALAPPARAAYTTGKLQNRSDVGEAPDAAKYTLRPTQLTQSADRGAGGSGVAGTAAPLHRSAGDQRPDAAGLFPADEPARPLPFI